MGNKQYSKEEKLEALKLAEKEGVSKASRILSIPVSTICTWKLKVKEKGVKALKNKSGGHNKGKRKIEVWKKQEILIEKSENSGYGSSQIRNQLRRRGITISTKTINQVLDEAGYKTGTKGKKEKKVWNRFEAGRPMELVQTDITEFYIHKERVYLVLLLDDFSRFLMNFRLLTVCNMEEIRAMVNEAITRYGKMESILSDRGFVFHGWKGINKFEKHLDDMGIYHIHTSSHHPETIGKIEAVNKSIKKELISQKEFKNAHDARKSIEEWIWGYNYKRVHQGLGGILVPADRFHGWINEIEKELSKLVEDGVSLEGREINLFNVKLVDKNVELSIMGKKLDLMEEKYER